MGLKKSREALNQKLAEQNGKAFPQFVLDHWPEARALIQNWRDGLKDWEAKETFTRAYQANRMSVRTFDPRFETQYRKPIPAGTLNIVGTNRFRPDSSYDKSFSASVQRDHSEAYHKEGEHQKYHADRGLDSSAFAIPANFVSREKKYEKGLHDLSASLVNKDISLFDQIHNKEDGAFFAFLPLPEMEDQALFYSLIRMAKALQATAPDFHARVRDLRAEITRVKLAAEFDLGIGYSAIPVVGRTLGKDEPKFKLRYGLGNVTSPVQGETPDAKLTATDTTLTMKKVDKGTYEARQQVALNYKSILEKAARRAEGKKTEILIAIRHHNGPFPLYAQRKGEVLFVIDISRGTVVETGKTITQMGVMT